MHYDTTLSRDQLDRMTAAIAPSWRLRDATPMAAGHHAVYRLSVETPTGTRECYLKATPAEKSSSIPLEARILALLGRHTQVPVPTIHGIVDDHETLQAPFMLVGAMPGQTHHRTDLASLPAARLRTIARETGRHLADLHALDAVDAYGFLTWDGSTHHGEPPSGAVETVTVTEPGTDWRERLHDWATETISALEATRFADIAPEAGPRIAAAIDDVDGAFDPVIARIDNSLENLLVEDGSVGAMIDWEFTLAATPCYDIIGVAWSLAGGPYLFAPDVPDRRALVREALLRGYRERGPGHVVADTRANRSCYEFLAALRSMAHLEDWYALFDLGGQIDAAAAALRAEVDAQV